MRRLVAVAVAVARTRGRPIMCRSVAVAVARARGRPKMRLSLAVAFAAARARGRPKKFEEIQFNSIQFNLAGTEFHLAPPGNISYDDVLPPLGPHYNSCACDLHG